MKRKKYNGVEISSTQIDKWIEQFQKEPDLDFITSGNKFLYRDKNFNQIYVCKIEETVDLVEQKEIEDLWPDDLFQDIVQCECGGDKTSTPHSDWCPKEENNERN